MSAGARRVVVIGGGVGGFAAALALQEVPGYEVTLVEQARALGWVGTAIQISPNAFKALRGLGVGDAIVGRGFRARQRVTRDWATGEVTGLVDMGSGSRHRYGAPEVQMHRAALLEVLREQVRCPILLGHKVVELADGPDGGIDLACEGGQRLHADVVVGADGIHSTVRRWLFGEEQPRDTGTTAYRMFADRRALDIPYLDGMTKWTRPDPKWHLVMIPISEDDLYVFASIPRTDDGVESWSRLGSVDDLRRAFADYHPDAQQPWNHCGPVMTTAVYVRDPIESWVRGPVALLGDACHAMTPYMAQGGAMAFEDAVVLSRCLREIDDVGKALATYERTRRDRVATIQSRSNANAIRQADPADVAPIYEYDAWEAPLLP